MKIIIKIDLLDKFYRHVFHINFHSSSSLYHKGIRGDSWVQIGAIYFGWILNTENIPVFIEQTIHQVCSSRIKLQYPIFLQQCTNSSASKKKNQTDKKIFKPFNILTKQIQHFSIVFPCQTNHNVHKMSAIRNSHFINLESF